MKYILRLRPFFFIAVTMLVLLVIASIGDILLVFFYPRFYSNALFITTFGVAGVFASVLSYMQAIERMPLKNETARWTIISTIVILAALLYFVIARLEGGEYEVPFRAFAVTMALTTILFMKGKIE